MGEEHDDHEKNEQHEAPRGAGERAVGARALWIRELREPRQADYERVDKKEPEGRSASPERKCPRRAPEADQGGHEQAHDEEREGE